MSEAGVSEGVDAAELVERLGKLQERFDEFRGRL